MADEDERFGRRTRFSTTGYSLFALGALTVLSGIVGYLRLPEPILVDQLKVTSEPGTFARGFDLLYFSLQSLGMTGRPTFGEPFLVAAKVLGAIWALGAVVRLLVPRIESMVNFFRIGHFDGHAIVVGLGERGRAFARSLAEQRRVVAIGRSATDTVSVDATRIDRRIWTVHGDARDVRVYGRVGAARADDVVIVTQSDAMNLEIASRFAAERERAAPEGRTFDVHVHIESAPLRLRALDGLAMPDGVRLNQFSLPLIAARRFGWRFMPMEQARLAGRRRAHLLFVGFDDYAQELLVHLVRLGPLLGQQAIRVSILAPESRTIVGRLHASHEQFDQLIDGPPIAIDLDWKSVPTRDDLLRIERDDPLDRVSAVIICAPGDLETVSMLQRLRRLGLREGLLQAPCYLRLEDGAPFREAFAADNATRRWSRAVHVFGERATLCRLGEVENWHEDVARGLHDAYRSLVGASAGLAGPPPVPPWNRISEELRDSNRRAVDHLAIKLASLGYVTLDLPPRVGADVAAARGERDVLARLEHDAWCREKQLADWRYGTPRDDDRLIHDLLVPFDQLGPQAGKDAALVDRIFELLRAKPPYRPSDVMRERVIALLVAPLAGGDDGGRNSDAVGDDDGHGRSVGDAYGADLDGHELDAALSATLSRWLDGNSEYVTLVTDRSPSGRRLAVAAIAVMRAGKSPANQERRFRSIGIGHPRTQPGRRGGDRNAQDVQDVWDVLLDGDPSDYCVRRCSDALVFTSASPARGAGANAFAARWRASRLSTDPARAGPFSGEGLLVIDVGSTRAHQGGSNGGRSS